MTKHLNCVKFHRQCVVLRDFDRLVRLGLPVKCDTNTNEKSESPTLLIKIKTSKTVMIQALNLV